MKKKKKDNINNKKALFFQTNQRSPTTTTKMQRSQSRRGRRRYCFLGQIRRRSLRRYCFSILDYVAPIMLFRQAGKEENKIRTRFLANLLCQQPSNLSSSRCTQCCSGILSSAGLSVVTLLFVTVIFFLSRRGFWEGFLNVSY